MSDPMFVLAIPRRQSVEWHEWLHIIQTRFIPLSKHHEKGTSYGDGQRYVRFLGNGSMKDAFVQRCVLEMQ